MCIVKNRNHRSRVLSPKLSLPKKGSKPFFFFFSMSVEIREIVQKSCYRFLTLLDTFPFVIGRPPTEHGIVCLAEGCRYWSREAYGARTRQTTARYVVERETVPFRVVVKRRRTGGTASAIAFNGHREHRAVVPANWCTDNSLRRYQDWKLYPFEPLENRADLKNLSLIKSKMWDHSETWRIVRISFRICNNNYNRWRSCK